MNRFSLLSFFISFLPSLLTFAAPSLVISEIMYHPPDRGEVLEFIELYNPEPPRIDLSDWAITGDIECEFPAGITLMPGKRLVIARAPALLVKSRSLTVQVLPFSGRLGNGGGTLNLVNPSHVIVLKIKYKDVFPWPETPDGTGHSLSLIDPLLDPSDPSSWAPSPAIGGTPGAPNDLTTGYGQLKKDPQASPLLINEVKESPDGFVELFNPSDKPLSLENYFITNNFSELKRYIFPSGVMIKPFGFFVITEKAFGPGFTIESEAAEFALTAPGGNRVIDCIKVKGLKPGTSAGRYPDGSGTVYNPCKPTPGGKASIDPLPDLVISEIMYHPITEDKNDEYIEIYNRSGKTVDLSQFRIKGGISFTFPDKSRIGSKQFIVIAKNPSHLKARYSISGSQLFGPYKNSLSDSGETIRIKDAKGFILDEVCYSDRAPWPKWADGLGSSLELINLDSGNDYPGAWGASDSSKRARWAIYTYKGEYHKFQGQTVSEFQFLLLDAGQCLIDSVQLVAKGERLITEGFEHGALNWQAFGTHENSKPTKDPANSSRRCYLISSTGSGDPRNNYVSVNIPGKLKEDKVYYLRFRAKWQRGAAQLLTRSVGQGIAKTHLLPIPKQLGTPGAKNSIARTERVPVIAEPIQVPVSPEPTRAVSIEVCIDGQTQSAQVHYRRNGADLWHSKPLKLSGKPAGRGKSFWSGIIPPQQEGIIQFYIEAKNRENRSGFYPPNGAAKPMLYLVGLKCRKNLPTYHLLITYNDWKLLNARPRLSNKVTHASFVYGKDFIFHNVTFRPRGSPFTRSKQKENNGNWRINFGAKQLGLKHTLTLDRQRQDSSFQHERTVHWLLTCMKTPSSRERYVYFNIFGHQEGLCEDVERIDRDFVKKWFPGGGVGNLHKIDDYWEISPGHKAYVEAKFIYKGNSPEAYRWNFPQRAAGSIENYQPLIKLISILDPKVTGNTFSKIVGNYLDVDQWLRAFAVRTIVDDRDTIGRGRGKNAYIYKSPGEKGLWHLLVWDSDLTFRNPNSPLIMDKFASFKRLLSVPRFKRQFLSYLGFLAQGPFSPPQLSKILSDTSAVCHGNTKGILDYAQKRCSFVLNQIPRGPNFTIQRAQRIPQHGKPDLLRISGTAPYLASRFSLNGRPGSYRMINENTFLADFEIGPEGGTTNFSADFFDGKRIASGLIKFSSRKEAIALKKTFKPEPPTQFSPAEKPLPIYTLNLGDKLLHPEQFVEKQPAEIASINPTQSKEPTKKEVDVEPVDPFANLEGGKQSEGAKEAEDYALNSTNHDKTTTALRRSKTDSGSSYYDPKKVTRSLTSIGQELDDSKDIPGESGNKASSTTSWALKTKNRSTSDSSLVLLLGSIILGILLVSGIIVLAYYQWKKLSFTTTELTSPKKTSAQGTAPRQAAPGQATPGPSHGRPSIPAATQRRRAASGIAQKKLIISDINNLANPDFETARTAFNNLRRHGNQAVPYLLKAQVHKGMTPFEKIRRNSSGDFHPVPISGAVQKIPVRTVVQFLIKIIRATARPS